jgi:hypothetical protein
MVPIQDDSGELMHPDPAAVSRVEAGGVARATVLPPLAESPAAAVPAQAQAELEGMLLPTEHVTFASSPHPIIFVAPVIGFAVIAIVLVVVLGWETHPIVRGHHVTIPLVNGVLRNVVLVVGALLLLREVLSLLRRLFHYLAYRVVTTNRRVFVVEGMFGRRVKPLGNTALAGATMSQGILGRMLGYGDLYLSGAAIRTMRDPIRLYHEFESVAMGVEGDTWKQAIRQTQIP